MQLVNVYVLPHDTIPKEVKKELYESDWVIAEWGVPPDPQDYHVFLDELGNKVVKISGSQDGWESINKAICNYEQGAPYQETVKPYIDIKIKDAKSFLNYTKNKTGNISIVLGAVAWNPLKKMFKKEKIDYEVKYKNILPMDVFWQDVTNRVSSFVAINNSQS